MFRRALQLNPNHSYALTMIGHEYLAMDERDKAAQCFRLAVHANPSHYNGWYGLGLIEYKKENYPAAMASFKKGPGGLPDQSDHPGAVGSRAACVEADQRVAADSVLCCEQFSRQSLVSLSKGQFVVLHGPYG